MIGTPDPLRVVIAGGGTGGHVFPGLAVVQALEEQTPVDVMWIGTGRPVEMNAIGSRGWDHRILKVRPLAGVGLGQRLLALSTLPVSVAKALLWLKAFSPHVVFGVGGYVSGPVMVAARLLGIPRALHEQNVIPGLTNRLSARFAQIVFVSFSQTSKAFPNTRVIYTGNPIRREIVQAAARSSTRTDKERTDWDNGPRILVLGGSQGARGINRVVSSALLLLWNSGMKLQVVHQTGASDEEQIRNCYLEAGLRAEVRSFISSIGDKLAWADLVIARAGAGTVSELTAVGKPAVLIPYPHAAGGHQEYNARELSRQGAAIFFREEEIGAVKLSAAIQELLEDRKRLDDMAKKAKELGRPDAAHDIALRLLSLCGFKAVMSTHHPLSHSHSIISCKAQT